MLTLRISTCIGVAGFGYRAVVAPSYSTGGELGDRSAVGGALARYHSGYLWAVVAKHRGVTTEGKSLADLPSPTAPLTSNSVSTEHSDG
jgi:hypothetical protein